MKKFDVVLLTESRYDNPAVLNQSIRNVLEEDQLVMKALQKQGLIVERVDWADKAFDWSSTRYALFRSTWDYYKKIDEFTSWLDQTAQDVAFINPVEQIYWNLNKTYLADLQNRGINTTPTVFTGPGETNGLMAILENEGWREAVMKPAISASGRDTYSFTLDNLRDYEQKFRELAANEVMLVQPFQHEIVENGEKALMIIGGEYTHAILKTAQPGEFRVQSDFGGSVQLYEPSPEEITFAEQAVAACETAPVYARVDMILDNNGDNCLVELELVEPELWFRMFPAAGKLAKAVANHIANS